MTFMVELPSHVLKTLVSRPIKLADDSDEEEDEDGEEGVKEVKASAASATSHPPAGKGQGAGPGRRGSVLGPSEVNFDEDGEAAAPVIAVKAASVILIKRRVVPSYKHTLIFVMPIVLWFCIMVAIWAVTLVQLKGMSGPIATLNMAMKVTYRFRSEK